MRTLLGSALVALVLWPVAADAQRRAAPQAAPGRHEFGLDVGIAYYDPDGGDGGIQIGTPLDVRVGFVPRAGQKLMFEPRFTLGFDSEGGVPDGSALAFTPGLNVLYAMAPGGHRSGMYLTGGAGVRILDVGDVGGTGFSLNGAVGWRRPSGSGALRYELGIRWESEIEDSGVILDPSTLFFGARIGLSLWR
ncbi:MAG TPA: hypothetical protein VNI61_08580 [Gemmatimonadales bacterium]|nr:hypothetical protein [Gemmatimonadales bacterium]